MADFYIDSNMSELLLRLAGDVTVRGTITSDGEYVGSVYNFINLACNKRGRFAYKVWERLISENSVYKDELYKLVTVEYVKGLSGQIDDLSYTKKTRLRQTPVMTLRGLQRLVMILGGKMDSDFRRIVRRNVFLKALSKEKHSMKCVCAQNLVSTSYSSHPSECLRDKQRVYAQSLVSTSYSSHPGRSYS